MTAAVGLVQFLRARLEEDRARALAAAPSTWHPSPEGDEVWSDDGVDDVPVCEGFALSSGQVRATVQHVVAWQPSRVVAEVEAKAAIMAVHFRRGDDERLRMGHWWDDACDGCGYGGPCDDPLVEHVDECPVLRALAGPYRDHPGFNPAWEA